jgi:hypothetical protein
LLAFSQIPGLILDFPQAEAKAAADVRHFFRYTPMFFQPIQKADVEIVETPAPVSRKRRRSSRHAANMNAEQDYTIPSTFLISDFWS